MFPTVCTIQLLCRLSCTSCPCFALMSEGFRKHLGARRGAFPLMRYRALKSHFSLLEEASDEPGVNEARGYACEYVAWQFLTHLSERESIDFLLYELPPAPLPSEQQDAELGYDAPQNSNTQHESSEESPLLLSSSRYGRTSSYFGTDSVHASTTVAARSDEFTSKWENLSALEIATVSQSKKFLSQRPVQKIINGVWRVRVSKLFEKLPKLTRSRGILSSGRLSASTRSSAPSCIIETVPIHSLDFEFLDISRFLRPFSLQPFLPSITRCWYIEAFLILHL